MKTKKNNVILIAGLTLALFTTNACNRDSSPDNGSAPKDRYGFTDVPTPFHGAWVSACIPAGSLWSRTVLNINQNAYGGSTQLYDDPHCSRPTGKTQKIIGELRAKFPVYRKDDVYLAMTHTLYYDVKSSAKVTDNFLVTGYPGHIGMVEASNGRFAKQQQIVYFPDTAVPDLDGGLVYANQRVQGVFRSQCLATGAGYQQTQITLAQDRIVVDNRIYSDPRCVESVTQNRQSGNFVVKNVIFDRKGASLVEFSNNPANPATTLYALVMPDQEGLSFYTANEPLPSILMLDDLKNSRDNFSTIGLTPLWDVQPFARPMDPTVIIRPTGIVPRACSIGKMSFGKTQSYYQPTTKTRAAVAADCESVELHVANDNFDVFLDGLPRLMQQQGANGIYLRVEGSVNPEGNIVIHTWEIAPNLMLNGGEKIYQLAWSSQPCGDTPDNVSDEYLNVTETYVTSGSPSVCTAYGNRGNLSNGSPPPPAPLPSGSVNGGSSASITVTLPNGQTVPGTVTVH